MIKTITLEQAIDKSPSIDCSMPSIEISDRYEMISTKRLLEKAITEGWRIIDSFQIGHGVTTQHFVSLIHDVILNNSNIIDHGYPFIYVTNSNDGKTKFKFNICYLTKDTNITIISGDSYMNELCLKHTKHSTEDIVFSNLEKTKSYFVPFLLCINSFKNRILNQKEKSFLLTKYKISIDTGENIWDTFIVIHKSLLKNKRSLKQKMKLSQTFWDIMCCSLIFKDESFINFVNEK
jgi:hypothetical protein